MRLTIRNEFNEVVDIKENVVDIIHLKTGGFLIEHFVNCPSCDSPELLTTYVPYNYSLEREGDFVKVMLKIWEVGRNKICFSNGEYYYVTPTGAVLRRMYSRDSGTWEWTGVLLPYNFLKDMVFEVKKLTRRQLDSCDTALYGA